MFWDCWGLDGVDLVGDSLGLDGVDSMEGGGQA